MIGTSLPNKLENAWNEAALA